MKKLFSIPVLAAALLFALLTFEGIGLAGCANMIPPTGGLRDTLPPVLLQASPRDSTTNFPGGRITFVFDEFVELNNAQQNLIVSPTIKGVPEINSKLRTVTIRIKDTLDANTTYSLDFGNAIRDINEGNEIKNFTYIFSTGPSFDTLTLSGKVIMAQTGGVDSTLIVMLHRSLDDSAVVKERPRYYTRLDREGFFHFRNLPAGTFAIYALKDNGQKQYQRPDQAFAFANQPVKPSSDTGIVLYAYEEKPPAAKGNQQQAGVNRTAGAKGASQDKFLRVSNNTEGGLLDLLGNLELRFGNTLKTFDSTKLRLADEQFNNIPQPTYLLDSTRRILTIKYPWAGNMPYHLILNKDFAEDSAGRKILRTDTLSFRTRKESDYGSLKIRFTNLDISKNPVLLFLQNDQVKFTHVFTTPQINIRLFVPGEYDLRILYDENRNGIWDPGEFFGKHKQPEKVQPVSRKLNVKPNWDNEVDIRL